MLLPRTIKTAFCASLLSISCSSSVQAAESPAVIEGFACSFLDGKGPQDLNDYLPGFVADLAKIGSPEVDKAGLVIWTPYRGRVAPDFVWLNVNMTLDEWGKGSTAYDNSEVGQALDAAFFEFAECPSSGLSLTETVLSTERDLADDGEVLIESYRCQLHPGKNVADTDAAIAAWKPVFEKALGDRAAFVARRVPLISGSGYDLSYVVVHDDQVAYAEVNSAFQMDPDNTKSGDLFAQAHRCNSALFKGRVAKQWDN